MIVVFDKDIFIMFLKSQSPISKSVDILRLIGIFENEKNRIAITKELIERIESEINSNSALINFFQIFIKDIIDNKRIEPVNISTNDEVEDIFETFNNITNTDDTKFIIIAREYDKLSNYISFLQYTCIFSTINKPNKCWLIFNLLSGDSITVRYSDFSSNREIREFFISVFNFINKSNEIYLLDSYCNLGNHSLFEPIQKKGYKIKVHTSSFQRDEFELKRLRNLSKEYFGKSNTSVKFSLDKKLLHERTIAFDDVIIECNHDFAEIKRENRNWKLDITINPDLKKEIIDKCSNYN